MGEDEFSEKSEGKEVKNPKKGENLAKEVSKGKREDFRQEVAKKKKLDLVLEKNELEFPSANASELMMEIRTHKVLYSSGCVDLTDEVIATLDEDK